MNIEQLAGACHEANRVYCATIGEAVAEPWGDMPEWHRASYVAGVEFHLLNPGSGPDANHENWLRHKEAEGWVYGEVKDADAKTHPCLLTFGRLSVEQQVKDRLFVGMISALLPLVDPYAATEVRQRLEEEARIEARRLEAVAEAARAAELRRQEEEGQRIADASALLARSNGAEAADNVGAGQSA